MDYRTLDTLVFPPRPHLPTILHTFSVPPLPMNRFTAALAFALALPAPLAAQATPDDSLYRGEGFELRVPPGFSAPIARSFPFGSGQIQAWYWTNKGGALM